MKYIFQFFARSLKAMWRGVRFLCTTDVWTDGDAKVGTYSRFEEDSISRGGWDVASRFHRSRDRD